jgi:uncharacterized protein
MNSMSSSSTLLQLGGERFVSLTTYRRSGVAVSVPVWVARSDDALVVTTTPGSGKVKRLRRDPRVTLRPCSRRGAVADGAPIAHGRAQILTDPATVAAASDAIRAKYGWEFHAIMLVERIARRGARERVILRIAPSPDDAQGAGGPASPDS